jgi:threonyl-tRNA synthetase
MIVVGPKEEAASQLSIRSRKHGDEGSVSSDVFVQRLESEIRDRTLTV